ncbi:unnamed protein product [Bursaphelenchus xylophilus]|uniref:(pine wood nematode) hypothetical protein n=1 Tax=Bursaphelenchus xylophilus TaxID=6326 RepID=A0A1I7RSU7_BURXY|nr:unnamed protein product [Bursaphelenchus xylophilus]CAG9122797.1 unnamed protein product [Bursaphelenchus xylophilus]
MLIRNSLLLIFLSAISCVKVRSQSLLTQQCLEIASDRDCTVFNKCCDFKCHQSVHGGHSREHFCMALFGRIQRSECVCNSASSLNGKSAPFGFKHLDIVTGVFLLFAFDFVLLTFAL